MADSACYIELASNAGDFFSSAAQDDILIHPHYATQKILIGNSNSQIPSITVTSNAVGILKSSPAYTLDITGDINFTGTFRNNGTPYVGSQWSNNNSNVFLGANSNVGIGKSNPAYPLDVTGDINFTGTFRKNGTPYVGSQWSNDNSNVFLGADSNVGIAMSNPYERFIINGNCLVASNDAYFSVTSPGVSPSLGICKKSGIASMFVFTSNYNNTFNNSLKFGMLTGTHLSNIATVSPVEYMVLTNSGNLGIGNSAPSYKLDVSGVSRILGDSNAFIIQTTLNTDGTSSVRRISFKQTGFRSAIQAELSSGTWQASDILINPDGGNVAIGMNSPAYRLDVSGGSTRLTHSNAVTGRTDTSLYVVNTSTAASADAQIWCTANTGGGGSAKLTLENLGQNAYSLGPDRNDSGKFKLANHLTNIASNVMLTVDTTGNVGIGTSNPAYKLDVNGNINFTGTLSKSGVAVVSSQWTTSACNVYVGSTSNVGIGTTAPGYTLHVVGTIYTSGDIIAFSDGSAKSNLEIISEPLSKVRQLTGYTYNMPDSVLDTTKLTSKYTGLIAQQVMQVLPEAVHKDTDGKLSIAYGNIMGLVVEAIKEVDDKYKEEIQTLKNQMAQVMSKLENLYT